METYFFDGNIREILKYALSLDTKSQKQDYLQDVLKYLDEQLRFLDERIRLQEENERKKHSSLRGAKFSTSLEREAKIFYKQIINQILKLLTAIGQNPNAKTDELLEQELRSLNQNIGNYSINRVSNPFGHEARVVTPGFKVIGIKSLQEVKNALAGSEKEGKPSHRLVKREVKKVRYQDYIDDKMILKEILQQFSLPGNSFVSKETAANWELIWLNQFSDSDAICGEDPKTKIDWIGKWPEYRYFYEKCRSWKIFQGRNFNLDLDETPGIFFKLHFLFHGQSKTNKQAGDGVRTRNATILVHKAETIDLILKKYKKTS